MERRRSKPRYSSRRAPTYPIPKPLYYNSPSPAPPSYQPRRFNNRRFTSSSTTNRTRVQGMTIGRNATVKLPWTKEWNADITTGAGPAYTTNWASIDYPGGARSYPVNGTRASIAFLGSHFCTPLGNAPLGLIEDYPSGLVDWSSFYDEAICFGSSINIDIMPASTASGNFRYVLFPIATNRFVDISDPQFNVGTTKLELDALDFGDLMSYPGARSGYIRSQGAGVTHVKHFAKTKSMLGVKDIVDSQGDLRMKLPKATLINSGTNTPQSTSTASSTQGFLWYLRVFGYSALSPNDFMFTVRINYYAMLTNRGLILQETANGP